MDALLIICSILVTILLLATYSIIISQIYNYYSKGKPLGKKILVPLFLHIISIFIVILLMYYSATNKSILDSLKKFMPYSVLYILPAVALLIGNPKDKDKNNNKKIKVIIKYCLAEIIIFVSCYIGFIFYNNLLIMYLGLSLVGILFILLSYSLIEISKK